MELNEDQINESFGKPCMPCLQKTLILLNYEWPCFSCG